MISASHLTERMGILMFFKNKNYTSRDYECTNVIACEAEQAPDANYSPADASIITGLTHLHTTRDLNNLTGANDVKYYGHL